MLRLTFSNRWERLADVLLARLAAPRPGLDAILHGPPVVVPSAAARRALTLAMADREGVCANLDFVFLARWLWEQVARVVPGISAQSPFEPEVLAWRVWRALADDAFVAPHPRLAGWLSDADEVMRFELAQRVAGLLGQLITYRPDWTQAWQEGRACTDHPDEAWQAALWLRLTGELGVDAIHPLNRLIERLEQGGESVARGCGLPTEVHVFGLPALPPLYAQALHQLARFLDVHVYALNPCEEYWFDLVDQRRLAWLAARGKADAHETGNRLLAAWGGETRAHIDTLLSLEGGVVEDEAFFEPAGGASLLARLQDGVLSLRDIEPGSLPVDAGDRSLEIHVCHSLVRELEVLHDQLLARFAADPSLRVSEVLVTVPDLEAAAPLIEAVFGTVPVERRIPFAISGLPRTRVNAPARALMELISLAASRMPASGVFGLLQQAPLARRFGLDAPALDAIHQWMLDAGIRWGLDGAQLAGLKLPTGPRHTLADGLSALMLAYAMPPDWDTPVAGRVPAGDVEGSQSLWLGAFWRYIRRLDQLRERLSRPQTPSQWAAVVQWAIDGFLDADDAIEELLALQAAVAQTTQTMERGGVTQALPASVFVAALKGQLDDPAAGGVPTGRVTFAAMSSLRNLPFRVVCMLGLDDGKYPSTERSAEFDLLAHAPRRGDRQRRIDQRNLFLDLLLAARDGVYISYSGRSLRDNTALPPSVLVSELLDALVPAVAADARDPGALSAARARLVVEHPLQPFSAQAFDAQGDARLRSFDGDLAEALRRGLGDVAAATPSVPAGANTGIDGAESPAGRSPADESSDPDETGTEDAWLDAAPFFPAGQLLAPPEESWRTVSLQQIVEFFRNPCRYLLRRRLGLELPREDEVLQDSEPFVVDLPASTALARRLLPALLAGQDGPAIDALALAGPELPWGAVGQASLESGLPRLQSFARHVREATTPALLPPLSARIELPIEGEPWYLDVHLPDLRPAGLVRWRCDEERAGDVLAAWLHHLALSTLQPADAAPATVLLSMDRRREFSEVTEARTHLASLLTLYRRGLQAPLHFFPKAGWKFMCGDQAMYQARSAWTVTPDRPWAESADEAYRLALRGQGDPLQGDFVQLAQEVYGPLLAHSRDSELT